MLPDEPKCTKSRTERLEPKRLCPKMLKLEPRRPKLLNERELPKLM
jgi:hypothetical protein